MRVIVHAPASLEGQVGLAARVTEVQGGFILDYLDHMECPAAERERMLNRIIHIVKENEQEAK